MVIKPTVGRVVWYYKYTGVGHKGPLAAHVCFVHSDSTVNLMVIDENGNPRSETSVEMIQDGQSAPDWSYCCWMPYQIGQAAKTEQLEKGFADQPQRVPGDPAPTETEIGSGG